MKLQRMTLSTLRKLASRKNFRLCAALAAATVLSLSALLLAGGAQTSFDPSTKIVAPVARPRVTPQAGQTTAPIGTEAEKSLNPEVPNVVGGMWTAEGPGPITSGQAVAAPNNSVIGAVKSIAAHPSDASTIYVGTVNGGIWKTTDGGATWKPQTDSSNSLSIGAIRFDPTDGAHNTLIAGIGRFSSISSAGTLASAFGGPRSGVLLTTDGANWASPPGGGPGSILDGANITGVAARGMILLASSDRGMYRSTDGGKTFKLISGAPGSGLPAGNYPDLAEEPSTNVIPHGVVMVSNGFGNVEEWGNNGKFIKSLVDGGSGGTQNAGSAFDSANNFYVTLFGNQAVAHLDPTGMFLGLVGPAPNLYNLPESVEQDNKGNFYVGNAGHGYMDPVTHKQYSQCFQPPDNKDPTHYPPCPLLQFNPTFGTLLKTFYPATEKAPAGKEQALGRGTDWGALVPVASTKTPQCVMRYTSEGKLIKQFDVCTGTQLPDFASALPGSNAYELQIAPNGDTFVADTEVVLRLDSSGHVVQTYLQGAGASVSNPLFAMNFDPDGTSFWTAALLSGTVIKLDIATGNALVSFNSQSGQASGIDVKSSPLYTAVIGAGAKDGVYKSKDSGQTWTLVSSAAVEAKFSDAATQNVKIAVGDSGNVFVGIENNGQPSGTDLVGLFASQDGGLTWKAYSVPKTTEACPTTFFMNPGGQGELHFSIVADPKNSKVVYVGGDRQPARNENFVPPNNNCGGAQWPNSLGAKDFTGRLFRVSDTGFTSLTNSGTKTGTGPHADSRAMVIDAAGNILEGDDGGIFKRTSPADANGDWSSLVGDLQISEIHDLAYDPVGKVMFGANQDTGSPIQSATDGLSWVDNLAGDGGDVGVDTMSKAPNSIRYLSNADFVNFEALTFNAMNVQQGNAVFPALMRNAGTPKFATQFATPLRVNRINQKRLLIGFGNDVYESLNQGAKIAAVDLGIVPAAPAVIANDSSGHVAMVYGGRFGAATNADLIYVGSGGRVFRRTGPPGKPLVATAALPAAVSINDVTIDPTNYLKVYAIDDTHVYQSVNGGAAWSNVTGNLAMIKPGIFDSMEFVVSGGRKSIVVGTNHGVFQSLITSSAGTWSKLGAGLPNARVFRLRFDSVSGLLVAGTLGRGAWAINPGLVPTPSPTPTRTRTPTKTPTPKKTATPKRT